MKEPHPLQKVLNQQYHTVNVVQQQVWWKYSLLWQESLFYVALGVYVTQGGNGE